MCCLQPPLTPTYAPLPLHISPPPPSLHQVYPDAFPLFYSAGIALLFGLRLYLYTSYGWQYFMFDFCARPPSFFACS